MKHLGDLCPPVVVRCDPCGRRGSFRTCRLIERFGAGVSLDEICRILTASCRWRRGPKAREGNQYVPRCMAVLEPPPGWVPQPRDDTPPSDTSAMPFKLDEWLPDRSKIVQPLARVSRSVLAVATYDAAVTIDPHGVITLSKGAHIMRRSFEDHQDLPPGKWPGAD